MSDRAEDDLIALVAQEQRGFRRVLFAGFGILFLLVAMSAALGVYYYAVSQHLTATSAALTETSARLEREAFDARIEADRQTNRVSNLERAVRRTYEEFRLTALNETSRSKPVAMLEAVTAYLRRGPSLTEERVIEAATLYNVATSPEVHALVEGAAGLLAWERGGNEINADAAGFPDILARAQTAFKKAQADPVLSPLAHAGNAWVLYLYASSSRSNYAPADCNAVFQAVEASAVASDAGPQPLYWTAQCKRKLGLTREALRDYVLALRQSAEVSDAFDEATLNLAMNAFHGVGTLLIASFDAPEDSLRAELDLAGALCGKAEPSETGSPRMQLARACLNRAIKLRERLHQTPNQISGTLENVSFSYLRDSDFEGAFANASKVERTGLFPWNELVRGLSAAHTKSLDGVKAEREARRNIGFFEVGRFNPCELQALLNANLLAEARSIVEQEHQGESLVCASAQNAERPRPPKS